MTPAFQSLNRDGVHSRSENAAEEEFAACFNPSIGMVFIRAARQEPHRRPRQTVSIPQSGWCSFAHEALKAWLGAFVSFNPSIGMVFIRASRPAGPWPGPTCFNPSIGMVFIRAWPTLVWARPFSGFNPSIGMVFIRACRVWARRRPTRLFQSLNRDGVHSRAKDPREFKACIRGFNPSIGMVFIRAWPPTKLKRRRRVSIPQSGWCSFALVVASMHGLYWEVSIPQSGWCSFARLSDAVCVSIMLVSIPQSGWCSFARGAIFPSLPAQDRFNPSIGMVFIRAPQE